MTVLMRAVADPAEELLWLSRRPQEDAITGYDAEDWEASTWVLHAMYENRSLRADVTHHAWRQDRIARGVDEPTVINGANLDETTIVTGGHLGYVARPGAAWQRLGWRQYADRIGWPLNSDQPTPPCHRWFPTASWPVAIMPPPEGSLDEASLTALLTTLATHSDRRNDTQCYAFYASLASGDFDRTTLLAGPLSAIGELVVGDAAFMSTPSNLWPEDRSWFVWTDWDLWATKLSGSRALIAAVQKHPDLETIAWPERT